jgi:hypothetical protein
MCGAIPSPNTPSWRGAQLKSTGANLTLPFTSHIIFDAITSEANAESLNSL